jgi:hypothetical protein
LFGRRPRRLLFLPPPPEGLPGPAFIFLSSSTASFEFPDFYVEKFCNHLLPLAQNREFAGSAQGFCAPPSFGWTRLRNKVQALKTNTCSQRKPKFYASVFAVSDPSRRFGISGRGRPARERGQMRTQSSYSPLPRRARGPGAIFCTGGHDLPFGSPSPGRSGRLPYDTAWRRALEGLNSRKTPIAPMKQLAFLSQACCGQITWGRRSRAMRTPRTKREVGGRLRRTGGH